MKKYLVSGVPISDSGVGRLMKNMVPEAKARGYVIITPPLLKPIKKMFRERHYPGAFREIIDRSFGKLFFNLKLLLIRKSLVLFLHPQTFGFSKLFLLAKSNKLYLYVMDNSFFCIRSYNIHPDNGAECLRCLGNPEKVLQGCQPYPVLYAKSKNISALKTLMKLSSKITFLAQNKNQKVLLEKHFDENIDCVVAGLDTGEILTENTNSVVNLSHSDSNSDLNIGCYDIVYHGAAHLAKGIAYVIDLAKNLKELSFFIPESKEACELAIGRTIECENITFRACRWESGLREAVIQARLVINPSLWSAPIEGALLKSVFYASRVATVTTMHGFEGELAESINLIRLPRETSYAADILRDILKDKNPTEKPQCSPPNLSKFLGDQSIFDIVETRI
ncbi:hypothetical protein [Leptolyngbya sp. PCC 6406]|uniref:hypothetical protein n=1 Tax=Leptolyngbya sp. PCC 6406 TaxID=1173264 RepID=UPI000306A806|nr:hypothetical protein [Leptolyngbya sp. PCC 6406]